MFVVAARRSVLHIKDSGAPTELGIQQNAYVLARYAAICQVRASRFFLLGALVTLFSSVLRPPSFVLLLPSCQNIDARPGFIVGRDERKQHA